MPPSPIARVLSTFRRRRVRALLMGGQACILYGAAEFSRDVDIVVSVDPANLDRLRLALSDLRAEPVFFPALSAEALRRGHACHFRCHAARGVRLDVMSVMRGADRFAGLWSRRTRLRLPGLGSIDAVSLQDLVQIKKTQREKDWPMLARLVEVDIVRPVRVTPRRIAFWLLECRSAERLIELAARFHRQASKLAARRPALRLALRGRGSAVGQAMERERERERALDRRYWEPLRRDLERWRLSRRRDAVT